MKRDATIYASARPFADKNDCVVRAVMAATGCSYETASAMLAAAGRKMGKGTFAETWRLVYDKYLGLEKLDIKAEFWTVAAFIAAHPKGSYIVHKKRHAFAVVDGILHDWESGTRPGNRLEGVWLVTEKAKERAGQFERLIMGN